MKIIMLVLICFANTIQAQQKINVFNFQADNGFQHKSKQAGLKMVEDLGVLNNWEVVSSIDTADVTARNLQKFDVIVFNNNCGNAGRIFSNKQHQALQNFIRNGGGFVAIHCGGAIWKEEGAFQNWYEELVGSRMVKHPDVQSAKLIVENKGHISTSHLPDEWVVVDEWHTFSSNPRNNVNVLLSLDESSYEGTPKMGGDHPFTWYQYFDGGRSFFTSLGHTVEIYSDKNYRKLVQGGIVWTSGVRDENNKLPVTDGLLVDLNADVGLTIENGNRISSWKNSVEETGIKSFEKQDEGRAEPGSGMPRIALNKKELNGHNTVVFHRQELVNENEDAFDHLTTGSGYTWFSVMCVYEQVKGVPDVNSFFGNLRNTNLDKKGKFEGFWGGLTDTNFLWMGSRSGVASEGRWNKDNPYVLAAAPLVQKKYYVLAGRMESGTGQVQVELFVDSTQSVAQKIFPVNPDANPSKMVIGQERDATNHPGKESFDGEIARFLIYERPLYDDDFKNVMKHLNETYILK